MEAPRQHRLALKQAPRFQAARPEKRSAFSMRCGPGATPDGTERRSLRLPAATAPNDRASGARNEPVEYAAT